MKCLSILFLCFSLVACSAPEDTNKNEPKPIERASPVYPVYAHARGNEGKVVFDFDVDAEGKVRNMRIIESVPDHLFDREVEMAVSQWRYEKGKPAKNLRVTVIMLMKKPLSQ